MASLAGYGLVMRWAVKLGRPIVEGRPQRLLIPYGSAMLSAVALGSLWHGNRLASALDGLLSFGLAPVGYLLVAQRLPAETSHLLHHLPRAHGFLVLTALLWLVFALTVARGVGPLARGEPVSSPPRSDPARVLS